MQINFQKIKRSLSTLVERKGNNYIQILMYIYIYSDGYKPNTYCAEDITSSKVAHITRM